MPDRRIPVRPDLDQLKRQAKDLLRAIHKGEPSAVAEMQKLHPEKIESARAKLADAQLVLARSYEAPSWLRLVLACHLIDAIWHDDVERVRKLVLKHPRLLHEEATIRNSRWGPPMTYAANLGRDEIVAILHDLGARDLQSAFDRATLQSRIETARKLHAMMGAPALPVGALVGPAETLSGSGTALMLHWAPRSAM